MQQTVCWQSILSPEGQELPGIGVSDHFDARPIVTRDAAGGLLKDPAYERALLGLAANEPAIYPAQG